MKTWEQRLVGERISLKELIQKESVKQRPPILDWIARQREANDDSLHWWMTDLAGRNNMSSRFFDDIIHIAALKSWVDQNLSYQDEILVICEDSYLLATIETNLKPLIKIRSLLGWQIILLLESGYYILRGCATLARQILCFWKHYHAARASRPSNLQTPHGELYLIHQCLDDKALTKDGPLACRYFTVLPQWLEKQGKQVYRLPWLFDISLPLNKVYQKLRESSCLIPEDWLTWRDYVVALWDGYNTTLAINHSIDYESLYIKLLVVRERFKQLATGFSVSQFFLYKPVLGNWGNELTGLISITHYESMQPERVQPYFCRTNEKLNSKSIGYYHSLVTRDYLAYHNFPGETGSLVFPDVIITSGDLARSVLIDQGLDPEKVQSGPALRQQFTPPVSDDSRRALAVLLSLDLQAVTETLDKLSDHLDWINSNFKIPVMIKPHPMMRKEVILTQMNWTNLPQGWQWCDDEMIDVLSKARCCVTMATASIFDVLLSGCIALPLDRELTTAWNSADFLETEFPVLKTVPKEYLRQRLEEIFVSSRQWYDEEFMSIREKLQVGLNPVSDSTLALFL
ncbi:hypothetical protein [Phormidium sp. FACHB-1136]|uniref:hypothetical protein n=1 Tax=Phormidium sp. FACHB-1136 TaxID=2692848 RepID=UPI001682B370|nr:hypothetical protein [Phormidium sp. FACHB-1136]MBD2424566.1 hypothetical protein [Phormidium sp. FACHB-1136]